MAEAWSEDIQESQFESKTDSDDENEADYSTPPSTPTFVDVKLWVNQVSEIDSVTQRWKIDVDVEYLWVDRRIVKLNPEPEKEFDKYIFKDDIDPENDIWVPNVEVINIQDGDPEGGEPTFAVKMTKSNPDPLISMEKTYQVYLNSPMDLRNFPFDTQTLRFYCRSCDQSRQELQFRVSSQDETDYSRNLAPDVNLDEWSLVSCKVKVRDHLYEYVVESEGVEESAYSQFDLQIQVYRKASYYLTKIVAVVFLVVLMEIAAFWTDPEDLGTKMSISLTLVLTSVAFQFVVSQDLPKIGYNTLLDYLMLFMYFMLGGAYVQNVVVFRLTKSTLTHYSFKYLEFVDLLTTIIYGSIAFIMMVWFCLYLPLRLKPSSFLQRETTEQRLRRLNVDTSDLKLGD